ncbi:hypothetical protein C7S16_6544 [Burkholderia thailandensis]|uniref:Uncharacterized protein n=1 Tax=Burkholderia thailandensis TaxID=57975 RepID=A0AAW9CP03_BURTH|nr:hypothetical protein [Burkholderia thailandensis]MDW9252700.1 hypothetical protein [Burkholderia thailandensis]
MRREAAVAPARILGRLAAARGRAAGHSILVEQVSGRLASSYR